MQPQPRIAGRLTCALLLAAAACSTLMTGCGGAATGATTSPASPPASQTRTMDIPNYHAPSEWVSMIAQAGFTEYAQLGSSLIARGRVSIVSPPTLPESFNAYAFIYDSEIWINEPMFARYPDVLSQATIFLHELIHIHSQEASHEGPWWSAQNEFYTYWANQQPTSIAALENDAGTGVRQTAGVEDRARSLPPLGQQSLV